MSSNIVYNYAKSSADCYDCTKNKYKFSDNGYPTNMSVVNCDFPDYFDCYDNKVFGGNIEPQIKDGERILNPEVIIQKYANDFQKITCNDNTTCPKIQYTSSDPRLISASHNGQVQTLNLPPITSDVNLNSLLYDSSLDNYGQNYKDYSDINTGQYMYYINKSQEDPYFNPNFVRSARVTGVLYKDPMGSLKPEYTRKPLTNDHPLGPERNNYEGGLSWMQDSLNHREDLLSLQMRKVNRQRYAPRWFGLKN